MPQTPQKQNASPDPEITIDDFIETRRKYYDIPQGLVSALTEQESGGNHYDRSGKVLQPKIPGGNRARGRFQVRPTTAQMYGLNSDDEFENAEAGLRYLSDLNKKVDKRVTDPVQRWAATLAGYHGGEGNINSINRTGNMPGTKDAFKTTEDYVDGILRNWERLDSGGVTSSTQSVQQAKRPKAPTATPRPPIGKQEYLAQKPSGFTFGAPRTSGFTFQDPNPARRILAPPTLQPAAKALPLAESAEAGFLKDLDNRIAYSKSQLADLQKRYDYAAAQTKGVGIFNPASKNRIWLGRKLAEAKEILGYLEAQRGASYGRDVGGKLSKPQRFALGALSNANDIEATFAAVPQRLGITAKTPDSYAARAQRVANTVNAAANPTGEFNTAGNYGKLAGMVATSFVPGGAASTAIRGTTLGANVARGALTGAGTMALTAGGEDKSNTQFVRDIVGGGVAGGAGGAVGKLVSGRSLPTRVIAESQGSGLGNVAQSVISGKTDDLLQDYAVGAALGVPGGVLGGKRGAKSTPVSEPSPKFDESVARDIAIRETINEYTKNVDQIERTITDPVQRQAALDKASNDFQVKRQQVAQEPIQPPEQPERVATTEQALPSRPIQQSATSQLAKLPPDDRAKYEGAIVEANKIADPTQRNEELTAIREYFGISEEPNAQSTGEVRQPVTAETVELAPQVTESVMEGLPAESPKRVQIQRGKRMVPGVITDETEARLTVQLDDGGVVNIDKKQVLPLEISLKSTPEPSPQALTPAESQPVIEPTVTKTELPEATQEAIGPQDRPIERREVVRQATPIGQFGKFSEQARKSSGEGKLPPLAVNNELRELLDLPKIEKSYKDDPQAWSGSAQDTMNALAELSGKGRSSEIDIDSLRGAYKELQKKARSKGRAISPELRQSFVETVERFKRSQDQYQNFLKDDRIADVLRRIEDAREAGEQPNRRELKSIIDAAAKEHGISQSFADRWRKSLQENVRRESEGVNPGSGGQSAEGRDRGNVPVEKPKFVTDAETRLKQTASGETAGSGGQGLADIAIVTGYKVYKAGMQFADWAKAVIAEHGSKVRPYLRSAWKQLNERVSFGPDKAESRGGTVLGSGLGSLQKLFERKPSAPKKLSPLERSSVLQGIYGKPKTSLTDTVLALRKAGLLSGVKTHLRNIGGNTAFQVAEEISRIPSSIADLAMSALPFSNQRTITGPSITSVSKSAYEAATKGVKEAVEVLRKGDRKELMKYQLDKELNSGSKIVDAYVNGTFRLLSAEDKIARSYAYRRALEDRARARALTEVREGKIRRSQVNERAKEIVANPDAEMQANALYDSDVAVFANDNVLSTLLSKGREAIKDKPGGKALDAGIGFAVPFDKTPTNIVKRILDYSPVGLASGTGRLAYSVIKRSMTAEQQRYISQLLGRGSTGTALIMLGYYLGTSGSATGFVEDDKSKRERDKATGRTPGAILVGDTWRQITGFAPTGNLITLGATISREYSRASEKERPSSFIDKARLLSQVSAKAGGKVISDVPLLEGAAETNKLIRGEGKVSERLGRYAGSFVPTAISDIGEITDKRRETAGQGFTAQIKARIPGLRQSLPEARDALGRPLEDRKSSLFDPTNPRTAKDKNEALDRELVQLDIGLSKPVKKEKESDTDYRKRAMQYGNLFYEHGTALAKNPFYKSLDKETRKEAFKLLNQTISTELSKEEMDKDRFDADSIIERAESIIEKRREKKDN